MDGGISGPQLRAGANRGQGCRGAGQWAQGRAASEDCRRVAAAALAVVDPSAPARLQFRTTGAGLRCAHATPAAHFGLEFAQLDCGRAVGVSAPPPLLRPRGSQLLGIDYYASQILGWLVRTNPNDDSGPIHTWSKQGRRIHRPLSISRPFRITFDASWFCTSWLGLGVIQKINILLAIVDPVS